MPGLIPPRTPGGRRPPGVHLVAAVLAAVLIGSFLVTRRDAPTPAPASAPITAGPAGGYADTPLGVMSKPTPITRRIQLAEQKVTATCMADQGHRYEAPAQSADDKPRQRAPFGLEPLTETRPSPASPRRTADPAYDRAMLGDPGRRVTAQAEGMRVSGPADGCLAEAKNRLHGDQRVRWMELQIILFRTQNRAVEDARDDARLVAANERWRTCVHRAGYAWRNPAEVLRGLPIGADPRQAPGARVDLGCKKHTSYLGDAYAALADAQRRELGPEPNALTEWLSLLRSQHERAIAVLGQSGETAPGGAR